MSIKGLLSRHSFSDNLASKAATSRQAQLIISNAAVMWATRLLLLAPQLILVPYLIDQIGEAGYGTYALIWSLLVGIDQLQRALQQGVVKYSAASLATEDYREVNKIFSSSVAYSVILSIAASASIVLASSLYDDPHGLLRPSLFVVGALVLILVPLTPYIALIQSKQLYYAEAIVETVSRYAGLAILVAWFNLAQPSVLATVIIMSVAMAFSKLVFFPIVHLLIPTLRFRPSFVDKTVFKRIATFGVATVLIAICLVANTAGARWLMGLLISPVFVAHLAIIVMPTFLLAQIVLAVTVTIMPATSAYDATGNRQSLRHLMVRGIRYTAVIVWAAMVAAPLLMRHFLSAWVGDAYAFLSPHAVALLAAGAFWLSTSTAHHMLKGLGKLMPVVLIYVLGMVIVPFTLITAILWLSGDPYLAATIGLSMGYLCTGALQLWVGLKAVEAKRSLSIVRAYGGSTIMAFIILCVLLPINMLIINDALQSAALAALGVLLFLGGTYTFVASQVERHEAKELLNSFVSSSGIARKIRGRHSGPRPV